MPRISASTVIFYQGDENSFPVESQLVLDGIDERFDGLVFPSNGRTFLYGHNNPGWKHLVKLGSAAGLEVLTLEISVEIERWIRHKINLGNDPDYGLAFTRFLSLSRATKEVVTAIDGVCTKPGGLQTFGVRDTVVNPQNLERLRDDERFAHLWALAYTVETIEVGRMQVVTIFEFDAIEEIQGSGIIDSVDIVL